MTKYTKGQWAKISPEEVSLESIRKICPGLNFRVTSVSDPTDILTKCGPKVTYYTLAGSIELIIQDTTVKMIAGDFIIIEKSIEYSFRRIVNGPVSIVAVWNLAEIFSEAELAIVNAGLSQ